MEVDGSALSAVAADLDDVAGQARDRTRRLELTPDAGRSSDETAQAITMLASVVGGIAEQLATMAGTLRTTVADYAAADDRSAAGLPQVR